MGKLVWIASYPKSGNTWMRALLHNYIRQAAAPHDINRLTDFTASDVNAERYQRHDPRPGSRYTIADVQRMRRLVHRDLTALDTTLVFVKTHNARIVVEGAPLMTPEVTAGAIYIVRDPRDVAVSYSRHLGRSIDDTIGFMADPYWATGGTDSKVFEHPGAWSVHVRSWTDRPDPRVRVVRYEAANLLGLNFVLYDILAGGASRSLRTDTQGKTLALALLRMPLSRPENFAAMTRPQPEEIA